MTDRSAEVMIIGAGVIGASVAYHLAASGCRDIVVVERNAGPGLGSTRMATGGFRSQFGSEINVRLSLLSREKLLSFQDELGVDPGYAQCGYLFLAGDDAALNSLREAQTAQRAAGLREAEVLESSELRRINPAIREDGLVGGVHCPTDGFIRPMEIVRGYVAGAESLGVRFAYGSACLGFRMDGAGRIAAVNTADGEIAVGVVINAAGAWAGQVAASAGLDLPVRPLRRQVAATRPCTLLPETMPLTIFVEDGFHLRVRDGRVLLLWPDEPRGGDEFDTTVEDTWVAEVVRRAYTRVPCLEQAVIDRQICWAGLYEMSPDRHALLGRAPGVENLFLANGSSGHGVMHAPALGQLLAEIVLEGDARTLDVQALRPSRFAEGQPNLAPELL